MKYPCYIEFSPSGKLIRAVHKNQRTLFVQVHRAGYNSDIEVPKYTGALTDLEDYETIQDNEEIGPKW
jgi:hypothetical protein